MRSNRGPTRLFAGAALAVAMVASGSDRALLQPLGPAYERCGCSVEDRGDASGDVRRILLFQDIDDAATTTVRIDGEDVLLRPVAGELFVEWGSVTGTPVKASFAMSGGRVEFEGRVVRTCYENESCEAVWYEGTLRATHGDRRDVRRVGVGCGC